MSHYRVAVFQTADSPDVDELMAPYDENMRVAPYIDMTRAEALELAHKRIAEAKEYLESEEHSDDEADNRWVKQRIAHIDDTDEELLDWLAEWYEQDRDEEGNFLTTYNPKSKWDYYGEMDSYTFDEWLGSGTEMTEEELRREWKILSTQGDGFYSKKHYTETYGDEDTFVRTCQLPEGWAVVTPDGEWHEPGEVGWWGMDNSTMDTRMDWLNHFQERFVEPYDHDKTTVVMLDCHI